MSHQHGRIESELQALVDTIRQGLPDSPGGLSADQFNRLCENIARAVIQAVSTHETRLHAQTPEFGEPGMDDEDAASSS